jgi:hypothetical protein
MIHFFFNFNFFVNYFYSNTPLNGKGMKKTHSKRTPTPSHFCFQNPSKIAPEITKSEKNAKPFFAKS